MKGLAGHNRRMTGFVLKYWLKFYFPKVYIKHKNLLIYSGTIEKYKIYLLLHQHLYVEKTGRW